MCKLCPGLPRYEALLTLWGIPLLDVRRVSGPRDLVGRFCNPFRKEL